MANVRVQAAELHVQESVEDVLTRLGQAERGVQRAGVRVTPPGWITLTDARTTPGRELFVQAAQIGYIAPDDESDGEPPVALGG